MDMNAGSKYKTLHKGQTVFKEGQKSTVAYMLKKGKVTLYRVLSNKRVVLGQVAPGQIFGEEGLLGGQKRIATAEVTEPCEILVIDREVFQGMLLKSPAPIHRLMKFLINQVHEVNSRIAERPTGNAFLSICGILELMCRADCANSKPTGVSYAEFSKSAKDILLVTQLEIDEVINRLKKLKIVEVNDVRDSVMKKDVLGRLRKTTDFLKDRMLFIPDMSEFMNVARTLSQEMPTEKPPFTECLEFIGLHEFAELVGTEAETIYRKMSYNEIPETYFFMHKPTMEEWVGQVGSDFFKRVKRRRVKVEELEVVDDIVDVDNATLQDVFSDLGFHKVALLARVAGEKARRKIFANLSNKMAKIVEEQAMALEEVDEIEVGDAEEELISAIKAAKGHK